MASKSVSLRVNGIEAAVTLDENTPLLDVLRQDFSCRGVRFGCGAGRCGACTVLIDGRAMQSCSTPLWDAAGKSVTTIEGAAGHALLEHIRDLFIEHQAAQCGYCTSGIVATLAAIFGNDLPPPRDAILRQLDERHICRCGAHVRILQVVDRLIAEAAEGKA